MKISKEGKLTLNSKDRRVGNFVWTDYTDYIAFSDISRTIQTKVSKRTFVGQMLESAIRGKNDNFLHNYAGVLYYVNGIAPDRQLIEDIFKACQACLERNPDLYGKMDVSGEEDAGVIREQQELRQFEDDVRKLHEDEDKQEDSGQ